MSTDEVLDIEKRFWSQANDPKLFEENFADDGITIFEPAGFIGKKEALQMSAKGEPFRDVEMKDVVVREVSPDCVILAYHGTGRKAKSGKPYSGSIGSVYVKRDGRWQLTLTAHQPWDPDKK